MTDDRDPIEFDEVIAVALARAADTGDLPSPDVKRRLMARIATDALPPGFSVTRGSEDGWLPHPVAGIRMKILAVAADRRYATLLRDVAPGARFPPHHHGGPEECYVLSGSLFSHGRRIHAGDFLHADGDTDHGELYTDEGCRVLLVVPPDDYLPDPAR